MEVVAPPFGPELGKQSLFAGCPDMIHVFDEVEVEEGLREREGPAARGRPLGSIGYKPQTVVRLLAPPGLLRALSALFGF